MKRAMILAGLAALLLAAATVWWLKGRSLEVRVTEPQLRAQLAERFPVERTVLLLLRWRLTDPSLAFLPQRQRVAVGIDVRLNLRLEGGRSDLGGRIELETGVRYDEARGALFLVDPVITRLVIDGLPERHAQRATDSVRELLAEVFSQRPVYTLNPLDLKQGSARLLLRELRIEGDAVVVRLGL
ncbi:MAG TPA: DUF1439 domain-containing protein [Chiayiivirga sp.]|nr:DUF1439 domain-containing protein [Chiayiivirga sp.]